jgi:hypothetical protein
MRLVLGLSLTACSAAWALVDIDDGKILADRIVALDSPHDIARAGARSVQAFDNESDYAIEGIRLTWSEDAQQQGVRLRTKLRLFGFQTVETVSQDDAREGRNKTARYLDPHLALAYGAARSDVNGDGSGSLLRRVSGQVPIRVAAASGTAAAVVLGIGFYALVSPSESEAPDNTAAASTSPQSVPEADAAPAATPSAVAEPVAAPAVTASPPRAPEPVAGSLPASGPGSSEAAWVPDDTIEIELDSTVPEIIPAQIEEPHLSNAHLPAGRAQPVVGPAQPVVGPAQPAIGPAHLPAGPAQPAAAPGPPTVSQFLLPTPLPPVLSSLFDALP